MSNLNTELYRNSRKYYGGGLPYYDQTNERSPAMTERMLIKELCSAKTQAGKRVAHLFANGRQQFPELTLFELSDLQTVGIDPAKLTDTREPCRFWAHYEVSDRTKSTGTPYRDVLHLEPIDAPASTTSTDTSAMLDALRDMVAQLATITGLLMPIAQAIINPAEIPAPDPDPYPAGSPGDAQPHTAELDRDPDAAEYPAAAAILAKQRERNQAAGSPEPGNGDRAAFYELAGTAQTDGLPTGTIDAIVHHVVADHGFILARECLAAEMTRPAGKALDHRHAIVDRITELLKHPLFTTGQFSTTLAPGWQWTTSKTVLIRAGKHMAAGIEEAGGEV